MYLSKIAPYPVTEGESALFQSRVYTRKGVEQPGGFRAVRARAIHIQIETPMVIDIG